MNRFTKNQIYVTAGLVVGLFVTLAVYLTTDFFGLRVFYPWLVAVVVVTMKFGPKRPPREHKPRPPKSYPALAGWQKGLVGVGIAIGVGVIAMPLLWIIVFTIRAISTHQLS